MNDTEIVGQGAASLLLNLVLSCFLFISPCSVHFDNTAILFRGKDSDLPKTGIKVKGSMKKHIHMYIYPVIPILTKLTILFL